MDSKNIVAYFPKYWGPLVLQHHSKKLPQMEVGVGGQRQLETFQKVIHFWQGKASPRKKFINLVPQAAMGLCSGRRREDEKWWKKMQKPKIYQCKNMKIIPKLPDVFSQ